MPGESEKQKWYYDACVLEDKKGILAKAINDMVSYKSCRKSFLSHLAIGEAYGNCFKSEKSPDAPEAFAKLMNIDLRPLIIDKSIQIIGNDGWRRDDNIFPEVRERFASLGLTDAIHLATAIELKCDILVTTDKDLYDLDAKKVEEFSNEKNKKPLIIKRLQ